MTEGMSAESLSVNYGQEYRVKLGKTFTFPEKNAFHALKYDFKPLSVDSTRPGRLNITEDGLVNVSLPVGQGELGDEYAQFRGPKKNCTKECILIIDEVTGEAILERISDTVQLKAIRGDRKPVVCRDRSKSPSPFSQMKIKSNSTKSQSSPYLTPSSAKPSTTSSTSSLIKKSTPALKRVSSGSKQDSAGLNTSGPPKIGSSTNKSESKSVEKPRSKLVKSHSHPMKISSLVPGSTAGSTGQNSRSNFDLGMEVTPNQEISPLRSSTNPTPEPVPSKRAKLSISSGSSSDGLDEENLLSSGHGTNQMPAIPRSVPNSQMNSSKTVNSQRSTGSVNPASLHRSRKVDSSTSLSRTSSGQTVGRSLPQLSNSPAQSLSQISQNHRQHFSQPGQISSHSSDQHPASQAITQGPTGKSSEQVTGQSTFATSSSSSDSESSSDSSSSDSSSDSDDENDKEVEHAFSRPQEPARQMSMSVLRNDLNLSESGSDSDF